MLKTLGIAVFGDGGEGILLCSQHVSSIGLPAWMSKRMRQDRFCHRVIENRSMGGYLFVIQGIRLVYTHLVKANLPVVHIPMFDGIKMLASVVEITSYGVFYPKFTRKMGLKLHTK